jgi:hypothetical protein
MNIQYPSELQPLADQIVPIIEKTIQHYAGERGMILAGYPLSREAYHRTLTNGVLVGDDECIPYEIKVDVTTGNRTRMSSSVARDMMQAELSRLLLKHKVIVLRSDRNEAKDCRDGAHFFRLAFIPAKVFAEALIVNLKLRRPRVFELGQNPQLLLDDDDARLDGAVWKEEVSPYWWLDRPFRFGRAVRAHFHEASEGNDWQMIQDEANVLLRDQGVEVMRLYRDSVLLSLAGMCPDLVEEDVRWAAAQCDTDNYGLAVLAPHLPEDARDFLFAYAEHFHTCSTKGQFLKAIRLRGLPYPLPNHIVDDIIEHDQPLGVTDQFEIQFKLLHAFLYDDNFKRAYNFDKRSIRRQSLHRYVEFRNAHAPSA